MDALEASFNKTFARDDVGSADDAGAGVSSMNQLRENTKNSLSETAAYLNEGSFYGGYDAQTGAIRTSTKPPPKQYKADPTPPMPAPPKPKAQATRKAPAAPANGTKKAAGANTPAKQSKALKNFRADRRVLNYKKLFAKRGLQVPPLPADSVEACQVMEEELKVVATPDIGDRVFLLFVSRVEWAFTQHPLGKRLSNLNFVGYTDRIESAMERYLRDDLDELYIKYDAVIALSPELRVMYKMFDLLRLHQSGVPQSAFDAGQMRVSIPEDEQL